MPEWNEETGSTMGAPPVASRSWRSASENEGK